MARRKHHATAGRALSWVILAAVAGGLGLGACFVLRGDEAPAGRRPPPVPDFAFQVGFVKAVPVAEKPTQAVIDGVRDEVAALLDELYTTAFVDPAGWVAGSFPSLPSFFTRDAAMQVPRDLDHLSLGSLAPQVRQVAPEKSRLFVSLLIDEDGQPTTVEADTTFRASARTKQGQAFKIFHKGRFWLQPVGDSWLIFAYDVDGEMNRDAGEGEPFPGPSSGATP